MLIFFNFFFPPSHKDHRDLKRQHSDPPQTVGPGKTGEASAKYMDHDPYGQKPHGKIDHGTDQSHLQVSQSPEESLDGVGGRRHKIHEGNEVKIGDAKADDFL